MAEDTYKIIDRGVMPVKTPFDPLSMMHVASVWFETAARNGWKLRDERGAVVNPDAPDAALAKLQAAIREYNGPTP